jgi:FtsP/CotA-like multicopper oxidase with cupredoxin domain
MSWTNPLTPVLHTKGKCGAEGVPITNVPENVTTIELVINNLSPTEHVMHLHGGYFRVINTAKFEWCAIDKPECFMMPQGLNPCPEEDRANGDLNHTWQWLPDYRPNVDKHPIRTPWIKAPLYWGCKYNEGKDKPHQNLQTPLYKDTLSVWQRSWSVVRLEATNPGMWLFHCHLQPHIPLGMMMVFNVKPSLQPPIPETVPTQGPCPVWSWADKYERMAEEYHRKARAVGKAYGTGFGKGPAKH